MAVSTNTAEDPHVSVQAALKLGVVNGTDLLDYFDEHDIDVPASIAAMAYVIACAILSVGREKAEEGTLNMLSYAVGMYLDGMEETEGMA